MYFTVVMFVKQVEPSLLFFCLFVNYFKRPSKSSLPMSELCEWNTNGFGIGILIRFLGWIIWILNFCGSLLLYCYCEMSPLLGFNSAHCIIVFCIILSVLLIMRQINNFV